MKNIYPGHLIGDLKIPCIVFHSGLYNLKDVEIDYTVDPNSLKWDDDLEAPAYIPEFGLPSDISDGLKSMIQQREKKAKMENKDFYDGQLIKLTGYDVKIDDKQKLKLKETATSWFAYEATNRSLDQTLTDSKGNLKTLREKYNISLYNLNDILANPIGVSSVIISDTDNLIYFVKRSHRNSQYPGLYGTGAAGFINRLEDCINNKPNPFKTAQREIKEETKIECSENDWTLFSIGRALDDLHPEIFGELRIDMTEKELRKTIQINREVDEPIIIPFEPKPVLKYLTKTIKKVPEGIPSGKDYWIVGESPYWVPAHAIATFQSLEKEYGQEKLMRELENL